MKTIIINADDFGYSDGVCKSILELFEYGAISGTSLMTAADGAAERFRHWKATGLRGLAGVHLQLTGGAPLMPATEVKTLVDETGAFRDPRSGTLPDPDQVAREWQRQVEAAFAALGGAPTHLDSHHGVHRIPEYFDIYVSLARELNVPVRGASSGEISTRMRAERIVGSIAVVREWTGRYLGAESLIAMVDEMAARFPGEQVIEVAAHPGYNDEYLSRVSTLSDAREADHTDLLTLRQQGWPESAGMRLRAHSRAYSEI